MPQRVREVLVPCIGKTLTEEMPEKVREVVISFTEEETLLQLCSKGAITCWPVNLCRPCDCKPLFSISLFSIAM